MELRLLTTLRTMNKSNGFRLLHIAVVSIVTSWASAVQAVEVPFSEHLISTNFNNPQMAYPADIDGDGDIDAVTASRIGGKISWFENNGVTPPVFMEHVVGTSNDARGVFAADVDGDSDTDIISTAAISGGREVVWWENDGGLSPSFTKIQIPASGIDWFPVFAADVDGDGDTDVLAGNGPSGTAANRVVWFDNNGASLPSFTERVITTAVDWPFSVYATDLDGDGDTDVLSASRRDDKIAWYESNGAISPAFTQRVISTSADDAQHVSAADFDGDGDLDVVSASGGDDTLAWYENNGGSPPSFTERVITDTAEFVRYAFPSDVDGDGDVDVLSAIADFGGVGQFVWYDNEGGVPPNFTERAISAFSTSEQPVTIQGADIDDDGDTDALALTAAGSGRLSWFENLLALPGGIDIDIKPGNKRNVINPQANGGIWVAILSDTNAGSPFDPSSQVDIRTVEFGPDGAKAKRYKVKDINKDGLGDLLLRFKIPETGISCGDTDATLTGETFDGQSFTGTDFIKTVGCKPKKCHKKHHHEKHHWMRHGKYHDDDCNDDKEHHGKHREKEHHKRHYSKRHDDDHKKR